MKPVACAKAPAKQHCSFDISANLLNNNVLSDKLLWKTVQGDVEKPPVVPVEKSPEPIACRPQEIPLEISLLTLPFCWLFAVLILFNNNPKKPFVSTVVACTVVLAIPGLLVVGHHFACIKKHMYVHVLVIHEASLIAVLDKRFVSLQCLAFALVFAHLSIQHAARKPLCFFVAITNAATILIFENAIPFVENSAWGVDVFCGAVVLLSAAAYAAYVIKACQTC